MVVHRDGAAFWSSPMKINRWHLRVFLILLFAVSIGGLAPDAIARGRGYRRYPRPKAMPLPQVNTSELEAGRQQLIEARAELSRAQKAFDRVFTVNSSELRDSLSELRRAELAHGDADAAVARSLAGNADYHAAVAARADVERRLQALRDSGTATPERIIGLAEEAMSWGEKATKIQADAENADPSVVATRAKLIETAARTKSAAATPDASLRNDPRWLAAKQSKDQAKERVALAEARLAAAQDRLALASSRYDRAALYNQRHGFYNQRAQRFGR